MENGSHPGSTSRMFAGLWIALLAGLIGCVSSQPVQEAKADFNGEWSVKWCDKTAPGADCGGFNVSLVQEGDRLCGGYESVDSHLMQSDEGGSVHGIALGGSAVLAVESGRSGAIYLVQASVRGDRMHWKVRDRVRDSDQDRSIIALDDELERKPPKKGPLEQNSDALSGCGPDQSNK